MAMIPPSASAEELSAIAAANPEQWDEILEHPACYQELRNWIAEMRAGLTADSTADRSVQKSARGFSSQTWFSLLIGIAVGVVVGGVLSAALILVVLPGIFGGGRG
jgi:hypothetical protein